MTDFHLCTKGTWNNHYKSRINPDRQLLLLLQHQISQIHQEVCPLSPRVPQLLLPPRGIKLTLVYAQQTQYIHEIPNAAGRHWLRLYIPPRIHHPLLPTQLRPRFWTQEELAVFATHQSTTQGVPSSAVRTHQPLPRIWWQSICSRISSLDSVGAAVSFMIKPIDSAEMKKASPFHCHLLLVKCSSFGSERPKSSLKELMYQL